VIRVTKNTAVEISIFKTFYQKNYKILLEKKGAVFTNAPYKKSIFNPFNQTIHHLNAL
jgi:hypothetical protein